MQALSLEDSAEEKLHEGGCGWPISFLCVHSLQRGVCLESWLHLAGEEDAEASGPALEQEEVDRNEAGADDDGAWEVAAQSSNAARRRKRKQAKHAARMAAAQQHNSCEAGSLESSDEEEAAGGGH